MKLPPDIKRIIDDNNTEDLLDWSKIILFFSENKNNLTRRQKIRFYKRSESFRTFWNTTRTVEVEIHKNGEFKKGLKVIHPLNIKIEDIYPNDIYQDNIIRKTNIIEDIRKLPLFHFSFRLPKFQPLNIFSNLF